MSTNLCRCAWRRALGSVNLPQTSQQLLNTSKFQLRSQNYFTEARPSVLSVKFWNLMHRYENLIGITEVKAAQRKVIEMEEKFLQSQATRRQKQEEIAGVQGKLKELRVELDKTQRHDDSYLSLLTREHNLIKEDKALRFDFTQLERIERDNFSILSTSLRDSHEREREQAERTKYWSIIGSVIGALIGIIGSTVGNRMRFRELKTLVTENSDPGRVSQILGDLSTMVAEQQSKFNAFISDLKGISVERVATVPVDSDVKTTVNVMSADELINEWNHVSASLAAQTCNLNQDMIELKKLIGDTYHYSLSEDKRMLVYVGPPEITALLERTERSLEWKMKVQTLATVTGVYALLAITIPILLSIFGGE